jgi:2-polyprenyl-3-methyl-5-hydroxy-6-metoxy-1,4-benzoquinol methylase
MPFDGSISCLPPRAETHSTALFKEKRSRPTALRFHRDLLTRRRLTRINVAMPTNRSCLRLDVIENFPAYEKAAEYLKSIVAERNYKVIADIGGGANPMLDQNFVARNGLQYCLLDHSSAELAKADKCYEKIEADAADTFESFRHATGGRRFDLIFSHMFLEHVANPLQAHANFYSALKPGGMCVHIYPSPNNLPLTLNRLLPEAVGALLIRIAQPARDLAGAQRKFKAYYRMCGAPGRALSAQFEAIGYSVTRHTGYIGHTYYERFKPAALVERRLRKFIHRLQLPLTSGCLLVLERRT